MFIYFRQNLPNTVFFRSRMASHSYMSTHRGSQRSVCVPSAPPADEALPTYDTALSLKVKYSVIAINVIKFQQN